MYHFAVRIFLKKCGKTLFDFQEKLGLWCFDSNQNKIRPATPKPNPQYHISQISNQQIGAPTHRQQWYPNCALIS